MVKDLVKRIAIASNPGSPDSVSAAEEDPEAWWAANADGELGYSSLLKSLAPTPANRQGLLAGYFEPSGTDGTRIPSAAHEALARLVKRGTVRVILTTNFDRLTEQALEAEGIAPQVISRPEAVKGMAPLAHARATVIKLHGDYADLETRNTPEELEQYPAEWNNLLDQVFDQYGLLISGWSADWDTALVAAFDRAQSRRYPLYWDRRSSKGTTSGRLLSLRAGHVVEAADADELFTNLETSIEALERLAEPPLTTAMAIARLKRYLPDPVHRIDLYDLLMDATDRVVREIGDQPISDPNCTWELVDETYTAFLRSSIPLLRLLTTGVWHDHEGEHSGLWCEVLQRLLSAGNAPIPNGSFNQHLRDARFYPALLALQAMGVVSVARNRDADLIRLLLEVEMRDPYRNDLSVPAVHALHVNARLDGEVVNALPRFGGTRWNFPGSHMLKEDLREVLQEFFPDYQGYASAVHGYEYRVGLVQEATKAEGAYRAMSGEYVGEREWKADGSLTAEQEFRKSAAKGARDWPWTGLLGDLKNLEETLLRHREVVSKYKRWG
ncbi:SIR2 family protein [Rhodococcus koreensis]|uniref:SIR2 family protein n=1 Tax=Rhodococcus koreensis TaxID=99653 RepID=UPI001428D28C|nr:SIR2 family protein [Rhodococcus koreensis]